ncbi:hypothetical protein M0802_016939 [Mischocyttarus mexicanus]|nr:hypothetical protein M0802_016939 [Mischocyttarus mexicanus]
MAEGDEDATVKSKKAAGKRLARSLSCVGVLIMVCTYSLMSMVYWVVLLGWKGWVTEQSMGETKVKTRLRTNTSLIWASGRGRFKGCPCPDLSAPDADYHTPTTN